MQAGEGNAPAPEKGARGNQAGNSAERLAMSFKDFLGKFGGLGNLVALASDPSKFLGAAIGAAPGAMHTVGRFRLVSEISARAATLGANCHRALTAATIQKRDVAPDEIAILEAQT